MVGFDRPYRVRPTDLPTDRPPSSSRMALPCESICEYSRAVGRSLGRSVSLSVCLNECWKGMDTAAAACATLGERDIILNGMVLTAAIRCTLYGLPRIAMSMNSVDCEG